MRILYFTKKLTVHDRRFLLKLAHSGHETYLLLLEKDRQPPAELPTGVRTLGSLDAEPGGDPTRWAPAAPALAKVLNQVRPSVVHAGPVQSCGYVATLAGARPLLVMSWGSDLLRDAERGSAWQEATRHALSHADMLMVDCDTLRARAREFAPFEDARILQFPWGVDLSRFPAAPGDWRARLGWERACIVLSTRAWEPGYGIEVLLEAVERAHSRHPLLRLVLAGEGSLAPKIEQYVQAHGLGAAVHRPGSIGERDMPGLFAAADLYLSCCPIDGASISLLEAMASERVVIVADAPGNREWVKPGENGWLVAATDADAFAAAIVRAAELDEGARREIGKRNRTVCEARADWDRNFSKLLAAYERLASGGT